MGLGWFVVYVRVVLLFVSNLRYVGQSSIKNWGLIPLQVTLCSFFFFFFWDKISHVQFNVHNHYAYL